MLVTSPHQEDQSPWVRGEDKTEALLLGLGGHPVARARPGVLHLALSHVSRSSSHVTLITWYPRSGEAPTRCGLPQTMVTLLGELACLLGLLGEAGKASMSVTVSRSEAAAPGPITVMEALADVWPEAVLMRQV